LIGNGIATIVVAKSEKEFDEEKNRTVLEELNQSKKAA
jgi:aerobic C4-dicarboxylate transport protein